MLRQEFIELLRTDSAFREEVRRQVLTDDVLDLPRKFDRLSEQISKLVEAMQHLTEAQQRTEEALQRTEQALQQLLKWQRGETGRRDGERYEREVIRNAPILLHGGHGGSPEHPKIQQRLTEVLMPRLGEDLLETEASPYLADLIWWKGDQMAVVEISVQVKGYDILRAARRAETLRRVGLQVAPIVIGDDWAASDSRLQATTKHVEWKVGFDVSEGFINFRRIPAD